MALFEGFRGSNAALFSLMTRGFIDREFFLMAGFARLRFFESAQFFAAWLWLTRDEFRRFCRGRAEWLMQWLMG